MYSVSLLPKEYRMIHTNARKKNITLFAAMIAVIALFVLYLILSIIMSGRQLELASYQAENSTLNMKVDSLGDIKTLSDDVGEILQNVNKVVGKSPDWDQLIIRIGNTIPPTISIDSYNLEYKTTDGAGTITGTSVDYNTVSSWLLSLEDIKDISQIKCNYSTKASIIPNSPVIFEITFNIKQGPGYILPAEVKANE